MSIQYFEESIFYELAEMISLEAKIEFGQQFECFGCLFYDFLFDYRVYLSLYSQAFVDYFSEPKAHELHTVFLSIRSFLNQSVN